MQRVEDDAARRKDSPIPSPGRTVTLRLNVSATETGSLVNAMHDRWTHVLAADILVYMISGQSRDPTFEHLVGHLRPSRHFRLPFGRDSIGHPAGKAAIAARPHRRVCSVMFQVESCQDALSTDHYRSVSRSALIKAYNLGLGLSVTHEEDATKRQYCRFGCYVLRGGGTVMLDGRCTVPTDHAVAVFSI